MATYPGAIKTWTPLVDGVSEIDVDDPNSIFDEVTAAMTELGIEPKGDFVDVMTRLGVIQPATLADAFKLVLDADADTFLDVTADDALMLTIGGVPQIALTPGVLAFQLGVSITTTAGDILIDPFGGYVTIDGILQLTGAKLINMQGGGIDRVTTLHGTATQDLFIDGNMEAGNPDERGITFRVLNAAGDAWVEVARVAPAGANPTFVLSKMLDLSAIGAGNPLLKVVATSDVPTAAWDTNEGYEVTTAPAGWIEIVIGTTPYYLPYWA
jgi:hypothetical protein